MHSLLMLSSAILSLNSGTFDSTPDSIKNNNPVILQDSVINNASNYENHDSLMKQFKDLEELVVTAQKNVIKSDGASVTYDFAEDDSSKGLSLLDALKKVPMVTVDGQDKIYINGSSAFKIQVNGKDDPMLSQNYSRIFKAMPADAVQKIEVITDPVAKHDAEGTGGILNLVTQTIKKEDGYSGSLSASLANSQWYLNAFGKMKVKRFSADANISYGHSAFSPAESIQDMTLYNRQDPDNYRSDVYTTQRVGFGFTNIALNTSWEPDDKNLCTFGGSWSDSDIRLTDGSGSIYDMYSTANMLRWRYAETLDASLKFTSVSANASYQHSFNNHGHRLVGSYLFNYGRNPMEITSTYHDFLNYSLPYDKMIQSTTEFTREHTIQIDYANPFDGDKHKLETGVKAIFRRNGGYGATSYDALLGNAPDPELSSIRQIQNIYAIYGLYTGRFRDWTVIGGIRYEHTYISLHDRLAGEHDFTDNLNDIVPNAALTYSFSAASNLRLAYSMRISRPTINQLNPFSRRVGNIVQEGNPDLKSEHSNKISVTYSNYGRFLGGNIYIDYQAIPNSISSFVYITEQPDGTSEVHYTDANIGHSNTFGLGGFLNISINSRMTATLNGRIAYVSLKSTSPYIYNHGWQGNYGLNYTYRIPGDVKLSLYGGQEINHIMLQGKFSGWHYYGLGISRDFLKNNALTVAVNASNFLTKYSIFKMNINADGVRTETRSKNRSWQLGLSVSWNFGSLKSSTRKTDLNVSNDDATVTGTGKKGMGL